MKTVKMKRILCLTAAALLVSLSACANPSENIAGESETLGAPVGGTVAENVTDRESPTDTEGATQADAHSETEPVTESQTELQTEPPVPDDPANWLDRENAVFSEEENWFVMVITGIEDGYFTAHTVGSTVWQVKVNGTLPDYWGVGDEGDVRCKNFYRDNENHLMECDFVSIVELPMPEKPVIYLYPETTTDVSVKLTMNGHLTCTYPAYRDGWQVTASPDGTLTDAAGKVYNYLYWEGVSYTEWDYSRGFCVRGEDTAAFLEDALEKLGLTRQEANEFIVYWLPLMEQNPYNVIAFQTERYTESAKLDISPAPDTLIRVFMTYYASEAPVEMEPQELTAPERVGFVAVEWGGAED